MPSAISPNELRDQRHQRLLSLAPDCAPSVPRPCKRRKLHRAFPEVLLRLPFGGITTDICFPDGTGGCRPNAVKQNGAVAIGGRVTAWFSRRTAVEGSLLYSPSGVNGFIQGEVNASGSVVLGGLHFLIRQSLAPQASAASILLIAGPVVVLRSGGYFAYQAGGTSFGAVFGIGLDLRPGRRFSLRAQIEDNLYSLNLVPNFGHVYGGPGDRASQQDFVLSLSISRFGR